MSQTVSSLLDDATQRLEGAQVFFGHGTHNAFDEAAWIMLHTLEAEDYDLDPYLDHVPSEAQRERFLRLIERRIAERKPTAYLLNEAWLGPYRFYVDERTIVPRSFIAELLLDGLETWGLDHAAPIDILDLCTGSGCLAIVAADQFPESNVVAIDISKDALDVAQRNVADYGFEDHVELLASDLFAELGERRFDLILSNPPYVDAPSMDELPDEYRAEPDLALASGSDGLDAVREILHRAKRHLKPNGLLIVEIGHNRDALEAAFSDVAFTWLEVSAGDEFVFLLHADQLPD